MDPNIADDHWTDHTGKSSRGGRRSMLTQEKWVFAMELAAADMSQKEIAMGLGVTFQTLDRWMSCNVCDFGEQMDEARINGRLSVKRGLNVGEVPGEGNSRVAADIYLRGAPTGDYMSPDNAQRKEDDNVTENIGAEVKRILDDDDDEL